MPDQRIGTCSICGGDVVGHVGPFLSTVPPPPPKCRAVAPSAPLTIRSFRCGRVRLGTRLSVPSTGWVTERMRTPTEIFEEVLDLLDPMIDVAAYREEFQAATAVITTTRPEFPF